MNNHRSLLLGIGLIAGLVFASFAVLYLNGYFSPQGSRVSWQSEIPQFATGLTASDGKAFVLDIHGGIGAYDAANGNHIWGGSVGGYFAAGIVVGSGRVCGGTGYATVGGLDEATGQSLWRFSAPQDTGKLAPESISIVDGRVVATGRWGMGSSLVVHSAKDGQLLWENSPYTVGNITNELNWSVKGFLLGGVPFEGNSIYASNSNSSGTYIFKLDTDNGNTLWRANASRVGSVLAIYKEQVIIQSDNVIFSLNDTSGSSLWSFDAGTSTYAPTAIYDDLLLFAASDGNIYALHLSDGKLAWKAPFDSANLLSIANADNRLTLLPIQIDPDSGRAFWSYGVTTVTRPADKLQTNYTGYMTSFDLQTGKITWTHRIEGSDVAPSGWAVNKNTIFLTQGNDLSTFDKSTGSLFDVQHFDHYVLPPVAADSTVFVAGDLHLTAYT